MTGWKEIKAIETEADYEAALVRIRELTGVRSRSARSELILLSAMVDRYEAQTPPTGTAN